MPTGGLGSGGSDEGLVAFGPIALSPSTAKTVVRIKAPSSGRVRVIGWHLGVSGLAWDDPPVWVQIGRISADGTFSAGSPAPDEEELSTTFQTSIGLDASVEPTYSGYLRAGDCTVTQPFAYERRQTGRPRASASPAAACWASSASARRPPASPAGSRSRRARRRRHDRGPLPDRTRFPDRRGRLACHTLWRPRDAGAVWPMPKRERAPGGDAPGAPYPPH